VAGCKGQAEELLFAARGRRECEARGHQTCFPRIVPDKNQSDAGHIRKKKEEKFKVATEAYSVLGNDEKREQYDRFFRCLGGT